MGNYEKLNLVNGTPFAAEHVAHMENGIAAVEAQATAVAGDVAAVAGNVAALGKEVEELKKNPGTGGGEGGGASLPEAGPNQYLVTDGNGQWGTAERLAYEEKENVALVENATANKTKGGFSLSSSADTSKPISVIFDGVTYSDVPFDGEQYGNLYLYHLMLGATEEMLENQGIVDTGVPFSLEPDGKYMRFWTYDFSDHVVSVYQQSVTTKPIDQKFLPIGVPAVPVTSLVEDEGKVIGVDSDTGGYGLLYNNLGIYFEESAGGSYSVKGPLARVGVGFFYKFGLPILYNKRDDQILTCDGAEVGNVEVGADWVFYFRNLGTSEFIKLQLPADLSTSTLTLIE